MDNSWYYLIDFLLLAIFMGIASFIKSRYSIISKYLIPTPILAGLIGLILGTDLLGLASLNKERLGLLVYHLMAIGFIALSLQNRQYKKNKEFINAGAYIVSTYLIQGIIGFIISLLLFYTIYPDLFPMFGLLLPLSFGQGPGQAYSIGSQWEKLGFIDRGNIGLTFATFGFFWAIFAGLPFLNYLIKRSKVEYIKREKHNAFKIVNQTMEYRESTSNDSLDSITNQLFLIAFVYFITYITLKFLSFILSPLGNIGITLSQLLWGFHFIIGSLYGILVRFIINYAKRNKNKVYFDTDNFLLQRITGGVFDFMITASISAISIYTLKNFAIPIILTTTIGGILTMVYTYFMIQKVFNRDILENILGFYGMQTGTISTGMALLKEVDPNLTTSATDNLLMGSAVGIFFGLPLMIILSIPVVGFTTGQPILYFYSLLAFFIYLLLLYLVIYINNKRIK
jgi:glutamate:Na+ symporter, ESS family